MPDPEFIERPTDDRGTVTVSVGCPAGVADYKRSAAESPNERIPSV